MVRQSTKFVSKSIKNRYDEPGGPGIRIEHKIEARFGALTCRWTPGNTSHDLKGIFRDLTAHTIMGRMTSSLIQFNSLVYRKGPSFCLEDSRS
jgi:hypothetical protein